MGLAWGNTNIQCPGCKKNLTVTFNEEGEKIECGGEGEGMCNVSGDEGLEQSAPKLFAEIVEAFGDAYETAVKAGPYYGVATGDGNYELGTLIQGTEWHLTARGLPEIRDMNGHWIYVYIVFSMVEGNPHTLT